MFHSLCVHAHEVDTETDTSLLIFVENFRSFFSPCRKIFNQCSKETQAMIHLCSYKLTAPFGIDAN